MTCGCGQAISAPERTELVTLILDHITGQHPEWGVTRVGVDNYLDAEDRSEGAITERLTEIGEVEVVALAPQHSEAVARFFDYEALPDNPQWASCYCVSFFPEGGDQPWQENRAALCRRIETSGVTGTIAFVDGRLVGWCNATARSEIPRRSDGLDNGVCSVVCFVVAPPYRFHGISAKLLEGAIANARNLGFKTIEGYPRSGWDRPEHAFSGSPRLFLDAGFTPSTDDPEVYRLQL